MGRSCQGLMLCSWVWLVCSLQLAAAYMDGYGESPGTVKWLKTSDLLKPLRDVRDRDNADNFTRTFAFDEREGNWSMLETMYVENRSAKFLVLMTDSRVLPKEQFSASSPTTVPYWISSVYINILYSLRHGYDFMRVALPGKGLLRHSSWYKLLVIRELLKRYDYLMYMDSDAFFLLQHRSLESLVEEFKLSNSKAMLVPQNGLCCEVANTGVMLFRSSSQADNILRDWWVCPKKLPDSLTNSKPGFREQGCFDRGGVYTTHKDSIALSNSTYLTTPEGTVIRHYWSTLTADQRNVIMQDAAAKIFMNEFRDWVFASKGSPSSR